MAAVTLDTPTRPFRPQRPPRYLIGVDGGGTGTRARLQDRDGRTLGLGTAGPSGLSQGTAQAWQHVQQAIGVAFLGAGLPLAAAEDCGLALALAGAERSPERDGFLAANPGYAPCLIENDAIGALRGAFGGQPGRVVAAGTGSVGTALWRDGLLKLVGGWGFPIGDEGSGAWLGVRAVQHAQAAMDGRVATGALARAVWAQCGQTPTALLEWSLAARQGAYAALAPTVFELAAQDHQADALLQAAANELARLAEALQPPGGDLALVVGGSVGRRLQPRLPPSVLARCVQPQGDAMDGALQRLRATLGLASRVEGTA